MMTTEYLTANSSNSLESSTNISHDERDENSDAGGDDDFVPPPSSWYENSSTAISQPFTVNGTSDVYSTSSHGRDRYRTTKSATPPNSKEIDSGGSQHQLHNHLQQPLHRQQKESEHITGLRIPINPTHHSRYHCEPIMTQVSTNNVIVGNTRPSPSWKEISSQVLPAAAKELLSSSLRRIYYTAKLSYSKGRWHRKYSDMGHNAGGFALSKDLALPPYLSELPSFSSLPWIDRQLVREWRTYLPDTTTPAVSGTTTKNSSHSSSTPTNNEDEEDFDFEQARTLVPNPIPRPLWQKAEFCYNCHQPFGPTRLRHHCRVCGQSFCHSHSSSTQKLPQLGYDPEVPERVCDTCKQILDEQNLAERVAWRLARCRDYSQDCLTPYFETGVDSAEDVAIRVTKAAITLAKTIPLGAQATIAVETVDVLRKYGLHGIYGIMLRQEFLAAADLLRKALGINKTSWPLSVHELSAAIFYALAQHRAMRGLNPEREHIIHRFRSSAPEPHRYGLTEDEGLVVPTWTEPQSSAFGDDRASELGGENSSAYTGTNRQLPSYVDSYELSALDFHFNPVIDHTDTYSPEDNTVAGTPMECLQKKNLSSDPRRRFTHNSDTYSTSRAFTPVCDPVPDPMLASLVFYAPIALNFVYAEKEVDMQLLAAQQGWRLLYAFLNQELENVKPTDRPASAFFLHREHKIACISVRGTATINDVVTDIRQIPVPFPDVDQDHATDTNDDDWTNVFHGQGVALCGMASAAINLFREHIDSILYFAKQQYRIRLVGHSLGGGVATLMGMLVLKHIERFTDLKQSYGANLEETALLKVYAYGTPSCLDAKLAASVDSFVTTVVLHDDVFPRLTPTSCRGLLKHLLHIRETWVKTHIEEDLRAVGERAKTAWAPRFRQNFALQSSSTSIKKYCKKQIQKGKMKLISVKDKAIGRHPNVELYKDGDVRYDKQRNLYEGAVEGGSEVESLASSDPSDWGEKFFKPTTEWSISESFDGSTKEESGQKKERPAVQAQLLLEFMGGGDNHTEGIVIDGDEFFEPEESLLESSVDSSDYSSEGIFSDPLAECSHEPLTNSDSWSSDLNGSDMSFTKKSDVLESTEDAGSPAIVLEESPLPRMFIPGKVIHIYSHRGVYKAAYVPRTFRELRRISLAGNMLSNHTSKSYFEGLLEVQTARAAPEAPPKWTAFDEDDTCCCCANRFTWASTSNSLAQEARDKHNCRSCGGLVCDPCAKSCAPIPSIGITVPARVCDRCYNDILGGVSAASVTSSCLAADEDDNMLSDSSPVRYSGRDERPQRRRQKRSVVVDNLVSQMRSSALSNNQ